MSRCWVPPLSASDRRRPDPNPLRPRRAGGEGRGASRETHAARTRQQLTAAAAVPTCTVRAARHRARRHLHAAVRPTFADRSLVFRFFLHRFFSTFGLCETTGTIKYTKIRPGRAARYYEAAFAYGGPGYRHLTRETLIRHECSIGVNFLENEKKRDKTVSVIAGYHKRTVL